MFLDDPGRRWALVSMIYEMAQLIDYRPRCSLCSSFHQTEWSFFHASHANRTVGRSSRQAGGSNEGMDDDSQEHRQVRNELTNYPTHAHPKTSFPFASPPTQIKQNVCSYLWAQGRWRRLHYEWKHPPQARFLTRFQTRPSFPRVPLVATTREWR